MLQLNLIDNGAEQIQTNWIDSLNQDVTPIEFRAFPPVATPQEQAAHEEQEPERWDGLS